MAFHLGAHVKKAAGALAGHRGKAMHGAAQGAPKKRRRTSRRRGSRGISRAKAEQLVKDAEQRTMLMAALFGRR